MTVLLLVALMQCDPSLLPMDTWQSLYDAVSYPHTQMFAYYHDASLVDVLLFILL